jgi:hypothetical protein
MRGLREDAILDPENLCAEPVKFGHRKSRALGHDDGFGCIDTGLRTAIELVAAGKRPAGWPRVLTQAPKSEICARIAEGEALRDICRSEHIQRSRVRIDTRKWPMAKRAPKKCAEHVTQDVEAKGEPVSFPIVRIYSPKPPDDDSHGML